MIPQVATMVEAASGRIKTGDHAVIGQPGEVVRRRAVLKAVCHDEVESLVCYGHSQAVSSASHTPAVTPCSVVKSVILKIVHTDFGPLIGGGRGASARCGRRQDLGNPRCKSR